MQQGLQLAVTLEGREDGICCHRHSQWHYAACRTTQAHLTMRFESTAKVPAQCKLKYYRISKCTS